MDAQQRNLLDFIYSIEGESDYNMWNHGTEIRPDKPLTELTVKEVLHWQQRNRTELPLERQFSAAGAGQIVYTTLSGLVRNGVINLDDLYNEETQDKANLHLLNRRGYPAWKSGRISTEEFGNRLSMEWAALPVLQDTYHRKKRHRLKRGQGYHDGTSNNSAQVGANEFQSVLENSGTPVISGSGTVGSNGHGENVPLRTFSAGFNSDRQFYPADEVSGTIPPWKKGLELEKRSEGDNDNDTDTGVLAPVSNKPYEDRYKTRGGSGGGGQQLSDTWWQTFKDEWTDAGIVRHVKHEIDKVRYVNTEFDGVAEARRTGLGIAEARYLSKAISRPHYNFLLTNIKAEQERNRRRQVSNYASAMFLGAMTNPDSLLTLAVPIGFGASAVRGFGGNFIRTGLKSSAAVFPVEAGLEQLRSGYDPSATGMHSLMRVGIATGAAGLLGGGFGGMYGRGARDTLINDMTQQIAASRGISRNSDNLNIGGGKTAKVRFVDAEDLKPEIKTKLKENEGVAVHKGEILVDERSTLEWYKRGNTPENVSTPNELAEWQIQKAASMERLRFAEGKVDADSVEIPVRGEVQAGWAKIATEEADEAVSKYRAENNQILQGSKLEALARLTDSPYKRIHRNALNAETRTLMDLLIHDGGFARGSDADGMGVASVFSRRDTWNGEVDTMIASEDRIFNKYLGLDENEFLGMNINKAVTRNKADGSKALSIGEFRDQVSKTLITGQKHSIPEINEMATEVKSFYEKFRIPAVEFGVIAQKGGLISKKLMALDEVEIQVKKDIDAILNKSDKDRYAARLGELNDDLIRIQELKDQAKSAETGPAEEYFTRVYLAKAIEENREAFKRQVVMPHMKQQPYIDTWVLGKKEAEELFEDAKTALERHSKKRLKTKAWKRRATSLQARKTKLYKDYLDAPEYAQWTRVRASTAPKAIEARADKFIDDLLQEGEPSQLAQFREAHRPTFGRSRVFNIQNSLLLKDGPLGNGIADFIETDYNIVGKMYVDRMGPAIEMARTFARPADGVTWEQGLGEQIAKMKQNETVLFANRALDELPRRDAEIAKFEKELRKQLHKTSTTIKTSVNNLLGTNPIKRHPRWFDKFLGRGPISLQLKTGKSSDALSAQHPDLAKVAEVLYEAGFRDLKYLGQGVFKKVFESRGQVVRVTKFKENYGDSDFILAPEFRTRVGKLYVEVMPKVNTRVSEAEYQLFLKDIEQAGYMPVDIHMGNVAKDTAGRVKAIDGFLIHNIGDDAMNRFVNGMRPPASTKGTVTSAPFIHISKPSMADSSTFAQKPFASEGSDHFASIMNRNRRIKAGEKVSDIDTRVQAFLARSNLQDPDKLFGLFQALDDKFGIPKQFIDPLQRIFFDTEPKIQKAAKDHASEMERDILNSVDRVVNRVYKNPDRIDNRAAMVLKDWSHLAFMGTSALSAVTEFGALIMRHGAARSFQAAFHDLDSALGQISKAGAMEGHKAGAIMDIHMGTALSGFSETGVEAAMTSRPEFYLKVAANKYFLWNGLAAVTSRLKELDASIRVPDLLDKINLVADDLATPEEIAYLSRFGISKAMAKKMADEPMEEVDGMWMTNTDKWKDENSVRYFRAAVKQGNENTIIAATAADKPIISDGVVYLKRNAKVDTAAEAMGWEQQGDYWKVQSGLMALPFTFWNYSLAATNKILLANLDEPTAQRLSGIASILGLAYMVAAIKTDSNHWENMTLDQRLRRAIDQSGVMGVIHNYHDLAQGTAIGAFGVNPMPWGPKYGFEPTGTDAAFDLMGAGPSAARNLIGGTLSGDLDQASWGLPFRNYLFLKSFFDSLIDGYERNTAGLVN